MGRCVEDLVHIFDTEEAVDGDLGDILQLIINTIPIQSMERTKLTLILKYVCSRNWNSKLCSPSLRTLITVCRLSFDNVTLYTSPKSNGHALRASSDMPEL
jgi:hypothetical protein